ncbi:uncharacterized protein LOC113305940 [Papaver somniferum]|uniref:uncharacterized protein LOC113305940 n=1 Tax=Papaver somniferum TaxID=3469 RepID=UPI000E6FC631|nr:uncharacterized protein LOC113305940 [Papaver somniferum]
MSEKFVHAVLNHGEHSSAFRVNTLIIVDELKHFSSLVQGLCHSCVSESPKLVRVVDHDADKAKPLSIDEWRYVFDNIGREFVGGVKASPVVTTKLFKHLIADSIHGDPTLKPKQIMSLFKKTYGSNIKYHHARRGKEAVFEDQYGDDEKSYSDLNCYRYLRPMIYLDATFLIGRFRGTLMAATCVNGNDGFYPYAFAIVLSENKDNWFWFLDNLQQVVDDRPIVFLSDRHEGLLQGIPRAFPGSYHSYCFYHIKCNLPIGKGDANYNVVIDLFYKAAYSYTSANFEEALRGMHAIGCGHVANYLRTIPKEKWANAFFLLKVMQMNSKRRVEGLENFNTRLTPVYEDLLNENINIGRTWTVVESMERLYEVRSPRTHSVDLLERTCTCHRWKVGDPSMLSSY